MEQLKFANDFTYILKTLRNNESKFLAKYNLTHFHTQYIMNLYIGKQLTMADLTQIIGVDKANTTRAVKDLLENGYIQKIGENKRLFLLQLSDLGKKVALDLKNYLKKFASKALKDFTKEEIETLTKLTQKAMIGVKNAGN